MRHLKKYRKFGRVKNQRYAFLTHLMNALILHDKIKTSEARAKEIKIKIDKYITLSKTQNLSVLRRLRQRFPVIVVKKLLALGARFKNRQGGYTRVIKLPPRKSDGARMSIIEFV